MDNTDKLTINGRVVPAASFAAISPGCCSNCYCNNCYCNNCYCTDLTVSV